MSKIWHISIVLKRGSIMITLKNEYITAKINEIGAELKSLEYNNTQYVWEGKPEVWAGSCPLMLVQVMI